MFAELGKVFTVALAGQFGWLAVGLALIPPFIVLATQWFWKDSDGLPSVSARFANLGTSINRMIWRVVGMAYCGRT